MNRERKPNKASESGITLIALIVMIIILIILSAVAIRGIAGNNGLIGVTTDAAEDFKIEEYRELIKSQVVSAVQANSIKGEGTTLKQIEENLEQDTTGWIKKATTYTESDNSNDDILVTTNSGHVFQVCYNDIYGTFFVEYLGRGEEDTFPKVISKYDKVIDIDTSILTGKVSKVEIYFKGEKIDETTEEHSTELVTKQGWYTIKVIAENGNIRYAWMRVASISDRVDMPQITPTKGEGGSDGWYRKDLEVTISSSDETVRKIFYKLNGGEIREGTEDDFIEEEGRSITIPITELRKNSNFCICRRRIRKYVRSKFIYSKI